MGEDRTRPLADQFLEKAARYRAMALHVSDQRIAVALVSLAGEYEAMAEKIASAHGEA